MYKGSIVERFHRPLQQVHTLGILPIELRPQFTGYMRCEGSIIRTQSCVYTHSYFSCHSCPEHPNKAVVINLSSSTRLLSFSEVSISDSVAFNHSFIGITLQAIYHRYRHLYQRDVITFPSGIFMNWIHCLITVSRRDRGVIGAMTLYGHEVVAAPSLHPS